MWSRAARKAGARTTRYDRDFEASAGEEYLAYLVFGPRQDDEHRLLTKDAQAVAFVGVQLLVAREDDFGGHDLPQGCGDLSLSLSHGAIVTRSRGRWRGGSLAPSLLP